MAEKLLINRKKDQAHKEILTRAIENNFRRETVFSFRADGTIGGNIRPHRILAGAAGIQHTTVLIFGVDVQRSHYEFQDIELSAEAIEAKLISLFSGLPGTNTVCYSREFTPKGSCYVAVFAWDESTKWHFKCQHRDKNGPGTGLKRGQLG